MRVLSLIALAFVCVPAWAGERDREARAAMALADACGRPCGGKSVKECEAKAALALAAVMVQPVDRLAPMPREVPGKCDGSCYCGPSCKCEPGKCEKRLCPAAPEARAEPAAPEPAKPVYYLINGRLVPAGGAPVYGSPFGGGSYCPPGG